jgi:hypothetical protein
LALAILFVALYRLLSQSFVCFHWLFVVAIFFPIICFWFIGSRTFLVFVY